MRDEVKTREDVVELLTGTLLRGNTSPSLVMRDDAAAEARLLFDALTSAGLAIVPLEPTEEMVEAAERADDRTADAFRDDLATASAGTHWRTMLAASPFSQPGSET